VRIQCQQVAVRNDLSLEPFVEETGDELPPWQRVFTPGAALSEIVQDFGTYVADLNESMADK
jgi:hypothetical protein